MDGSESENKKLNLKVLAEDARPSALFVDGDHHDGDAHEEGNGDDEKEDGHPLFADVRRQVREEPFSQSS